MAIRINFFYYDGKNPTNLLDSDRLFFESRSFFGKMNWLQIRRCYFRWIRSTALIWYVKLNQALIAVLVLLNFHSFWSNKPVLLATLVCFSKIVCIQKAIFAINRISMQFYFSFPFQCSVFFSSSQSKIKSIFCKRLCGTSSLDRHKTNFFIPKIHFQFNRNELSFSFFASDSSSLSTFSLLHLTHRGILWTLDL